MLAHTLSLRDCKCQWLVTQIQSHMGSEMEPAKREDRMTGQTLVSCLTHSVSDYQSLDVYYFTTLCIFKFLFSAWLSPFSTSLLDVDWLSFLNNCLRSPIGFGFKLLSPVLEGLSWNGKEIMSVFLPITTEMKISEKHQYKYQVLRYSI